MSNDKVLKGINFPGLEGTYYVPEAVAIEEENGYIEIRSYINSGTEESEDKIKLDGIEAGAQKNQNAFSTIWTANGNVSANYPSDTLEFVGQNGITVSAQDIIGDLIVKISVDTDWLSSKIDEKIAAIANAEEVGF